MTIVELMGAPGAPYTRKMLALMRYRHIPYRISWQSITSPGAPINSTIVIVKPPSPF